MRGLSIISTLCLLATGCSFSCEPCHYYNKLQTARVLARAYAGCSGLDDTGPENPQPFGDDYGRGFQAGFDQTWPTAGHDGTAATPPEGTATPLSADSESHSPQWTAGYQAGVAAAQRRRSMASLESIPPAPAALREPSAPPPHWTPRQPPLREPPASNPLPEQPAAPPVPVPPGAAADQSWNRSWPAGAVPENLAQATAGVIRIPEVQPPTEPHSNLRSPLVGPGSGDLPTGRGRWAATAAAAGPSTQLQFTDAMASGFHSGARSGYTAGFPATASSATTGDNSASTVPCQPMPADRHP